MYIDIHKKPTRTRIKDAVVDHFERLMINVQKTRNRKRKLMPTHLQHHQGGDYDFQDATNLSFGRVSPFDTQSGA